MVTLFLFLGVTTRVTLSLLAPPSSGAQTGRSIVNAAIRQHKCRLFSPCPLERKYPPKVF